MSAIVVKPGYSLEEAQAIMLVSTDPVQRGLANTIISLHAANRMMTDLLNKADEDAKALGEHLCRVGSIGLDAVRASS